MRWLVRFGIIGLCFLLWAGLWHSASVVTMGVTVAPRQKSFCFPEFLPGADMYAWSIKQDPRVGAVLLVQNIGQRTLAEVKIVFRAGNTELRFEVEEIHPGQKVFIIETDKTLLEDWNTVTCISYTARETENTYLPDEEDYGCK